MFEEQRLAPRERLALLLRLGAGLTAVTRDISAAGLYFETEGDPPLHGFVEFELELAEISMKFTSCGEIVRIERHGGRTGVAVRLLNPRLVSLRREAQ